MKFFHTTNLKVKPFDVYAIHKGVFLGHLIVFIQYNPVKDTYGFISMQNLENIDVPSKDLKDGIDSNLLRKTDINLQAPVKKICNKTYTFNIDKPNKHTKIDMNEDIDLGLQ